jgi:hypothetical protein
MDEQNLVFGVVDDAGEFDAAADEVGGGELAFEDGVLEVVAETAHEFEDFAEAAVVGDVVADEIGLAHGVTCRARLGSARVSASIRPMKVPSFVLGIVRILSAASQLGEGSPLAPSGKTGMRKRCPSILTDVSGQTVTDSVPTKRSF